MKIAGIVAEYNPFHNGHKYHTEETKARTGTDAVVAIMSGNFVQRGDCAIADKWTRANAAVLSGADLVLELPVYYSLAVAPLFAFGALATLDALGCVDYVSFGMEADTLATLSDIALKLSADCDKIECETQKYLDGYTGYPAARQRALSALYGFDESVLQSPNNMLALEYLCTLDTLKSSITPIGIKRRGANYHDTQEISCFSSAAALRKQLAGDGDISKSVPAEALDIYRKANESGLFPIFTHDFDKMLISFLRRTDASGLKNIIDMPHGFENRIVTMAKRACSIDELTCLCCARQYTRARVRRLLFASFIGIQNMGYDKKPSYVRVLAANSAGRRVLAEMSRTCSLPIITKTADYDKKDSDTLFTLDTVSSDLYAAAYNDASLRAGGKDFTTSPIIL